MCNLTPEVLETLACTVSWTNKQGVQYKARGMSDDHLRGVLRGVYSHYYKPLLEASMPCDVWEQVLRYEIGKRKEEGKRKQELAARFKALEDLVSESENEIREAISVYRRRHEKLEIAAIEAGRKVPGAKSLWHYWD